MKRRKKWILGTAIGGTLNLGFYNLTTKKAKRKPEAATLNFLVGAGTGSISMKRSTSTIVGGITSSLLYLGLTTNEDKNQRDLIIALGLGMLSGYLASYFIDELNQK